MRTLKGLSENRNSDEESPDSRRNYLFHTDLSPNSITLVIYVYRLRLPFLDFRVICPLIPYIRLVITFLFVEPRFRYPFLSPLPHDSQAWESLLGSPVAGARRGLSPQMYDMPVVLKNILGVSILVYFNLVAVRRGPTTCSQSNSFLKRSLQKKSLPVNRRRYRNGFYHCLHAGGRFASAQNEYRLWSFQYKNHCPVGSNGSKLT